MNSYASDSGNRAAGHKVGINKEILLVGEMTIISYFLKNIIPNCI